MVTSSSPSYRLLASLDAARWQLASSRGGGAAALLRAARHAQSLRAGVAALPRGPELLRLGAGPGVHAVDPLRVTLLAPAGLGAEAGAEGGGFGLDEALIARGAFAELPTASTLTFALSAGTRRADVRRLLRSLRSLPRTAAPEGGEEAAALTAVAAAAAASGDWLAEAADAMTPREAHLRPRRMVAADRAVGLRSAELICPYPPGIPVLVPGERITPRALAELRALRDAGCSITGCADASLGQLAVVA